MTEHKSHLKGEKRLPDVWTKKWWELMSDKSLNEWAIIKEFTMYAKEYEREMYRRWHPGEENDDD